MQQKRLDIWHEIENISQKMLDTAVSNQSLDDISNDEKYERQVWQEVADLASKRMKLIEGFFESSVDKNETAMLAVKIKSVLAFNKKLSIISQTIQKDISLQLSNISNQQRAATAYTTCL